MNTKIYTVKIVGTNSTKHSLKLDLIVDHNDCCHWSQITLLISMIKTLMIEALDYLPDTAPHILIDDEEREIELDYDN